MRGPPFNTGGGADAKHEADAEQPERPAPPAAIAPRVDRAGAAAGHLAGIRPRPASRSLGLPPAPVGMPAPAAPVAVPVAPALPVAPAAPVVPTNPRCP